MDFSLKAMGDACSVNDRQAEQRGPGDPALIVGDILAATGHALDHEHLNYIADQRGLRLALAANGRFDELKRLHDEGPDFVRLDQNEAIIQSLGHVGFLDGFAACARLFQMASEEGR